MGVFLDKILEKVAFNKLLPCLKYSLIVAVNDDIKFEFRGRYEWKIRDHKKLFYFLKYVFICHEHQIKTEFPPK